VSTDTCGSFDGFALQGEADAVLAKYDQNGNQQWVRQYGSGGFDTSYGIAIRSSNNNGGALVTVGQICGGTVWGQVRYGTGADCDLFVATFPK
jgi:hypothetical protein